MAIFIGHTSALEHWSAPQYSTIEPLQSVLPLPGSSPQAQDLHRFRPQKHNILNEPLHINVATAQDRRNYRGFKYHVTQGTLPNGSYAMLEQGIFITTPEACLLQLATELTPIEHIELGYELCGHYALNPHEGGLVKVSPRTSVEALTQYLATAKGCTGVQQTRRTMRYIAADSASPMETILTMLLCLPVKFGGYGLPYPEMNFHIEIPARNGKPPQQYYCDLCWPKHNFALEYDSDRYHVGAEKINHDSKRRTAIATTGIQVLSVTSEQVNNANAFDELARVVAKALGHRLRENQQNAIDVWERRRLLRQTLLYNGGTQNGWRKPTSAYL